jgi:glutamate racemase
MGRARVVTTTDNIAIEPMLFQAAHTTKSRAIGVFALPSTLTGNSYADLKRRWTSGLTVIEPDCYGWDTLIDSGQSQYINLETVVNEMTHWQVDVILIAHPSLSSLAHRIGTIAGPSVHVLDLATDAPLLRYI